MLDIYPSKYHDLIKSIERKKTRIIVCTIVAVLALILSGFPLEITINGVTKRISLLPTAVSVLLIVVCIVVEVIACAIVMLPATCAMTKECDPEKHLVLNQALSSRRLLNSISSTDYLYLGNYEESLRYSDQLIAGKKTNEVITGLYNKLSCKYLMGEYELFPALAENLLKMLSDAPKKKPKLASGYQHIADSIEMLCALVDEDTEKINVLRPKLCPWNRSKAVEGYVTYLKGVAACKTGDHEEAIYRLNAVKEQCAKTIFASLAEEHLVGIRSIFCE